MDRIKELIRILNEASKAYYMEDRSIMSDFEYDKLYDELVELEKKYGIVLSNSPTQNVGHKVLGSLTKVRHESPMLSLDKTKEITRLESFIGNNTGILSYKMDGLTVVLTYRNGELYQAVTRGNGEIGEDITHNARFFKNIPLKINVLGEVILRGEAVISFDDFEEINSKLSVEDKYKNPRNLCSGTVRQLNSEISAKRNVNFIAFSLVKAEGVELSDKKSDNMNWLDSIGFETVKRKVVNKDNIEEAVREFEDNIPNNKFATDGLVLTFDSISFSNSLGTTAKFPRDSIAFKWADELAETKLINIEWSTSRTGLINPIAVFSPVELEGTTVERASLHNLSIVESLALGIGDKITVYKANMIIPQVAENLTKSNSCKPPKNCPVCGEETEIVNMRDGKALKCPNPNCKAQRVLSLEHFVSRDAMNIEGFSEATIEKFLEKGFIDNYTDIFKLEKYKAQITELDGFGEKSYSNLIKAINKSKNINMANFIYALGINNVGLSNSRLLCKYFKYNLDDIINAKADELIEIEGFGEVIANSIEKYFSHKPNIDLLNEALKYIKFEKIEENNDNKILNDMVFVITGDVNFYKNRRELQAEIESLGGKVTGSVSAKTNYLINNDANSSSSKNKKAKQLNIPIISEEEYMKLIGKSV
ncbi:MAG: NAD-dependent DNA ligase LigA [Lachnospirales bacterium]